MLSMFTSLLESVEVIRVRQMKECLIIIIMIIVIAFQVRQLRKYAGLE